MKLCIVILILAVMLPASFVSAQTAGRAEEIARLVGSMRAAEIAAPGAASPAAGEAAPAPEVTISKQGFLHHLSAPPSHHFPVSKTVPGRPDETARNFVKENAVAIGASDTRVDFAIKRTRQKDKRNITRLGQTFKGIKVFGAEVLVQTDEQDGVQYMLSDISTNLTEEGAAGGLNTTPTLPEADAGKRALDVVSASNPDATLKVSAPELGIFDPSILGAPGETRLVWEVWVSSDDAPLNERILVDAHSGEIVRHYPGAIPARNRQIYDSNNTTSDPGTLRRSEGGAASGYAEVDLAYNVLGDTWSYYWNNHSRDSFDGAGATISVTTRYCAPGKTCPYANAYFTWSSHRMYFGDGWVEDDIAAHEFTHGFTHFESDLIYENHSGAINESISDIFGEFVDLTNLRGDDSAGVRWLMGEDRGAIRDMSDPPAYNDPDRMGSTHFVPVTASPSDSNDYGGVHTNSGVSNKLAFLLTDGETFNGQVVNPVGLAAVSDLYYEANSNLLSSTADYYDLYLALRQAAINLGWSGTWQNRLYLACQAVEIVNNQYKNVYVDASYTGGIQIGTSAFPFKTIIAGENAVSPGDNLYIKPGTYNGPVLFDKRNVDIITWGTGSIIIK